MSQGNWTGGLLTTNGSKDCLYEIVGTRSVQSGHESNGICCWTGKLPITVMVINPIESDRK
jgi:hypothetical protein